MKLRSKRVLDMMVVVSDFLWLQTLVFDTIPDLSLIIAEFREKVIFLSSLRQSLANSPSPGVSKASLRRSLEKETGTTSRRLSAYDSVK